MEEKKNQIWAFAVMGLMMLISLLYYKANVYYMYLVVYIWFGIAYGMMLQYGRFCFASASRDLFAAGVPRMAVGILVALIFFSIIQATLAATNMSTFHPAPFGIHTLISGMIFGVGMGRGHGGWPVFGADNRLDWRCDRVGVHGPIDRGQHRNSNWGWCHC